MTPTTSSSTASSSSTSTSTASSSALQIPSITIHGPTAREEHLGQAGGGGGSTSNGRLRTRSPKGQRGRPRKAAMTGMSAPPIQASSEEEVGKGKGKGRWMGSRVGKGVVGMVVVAVVVVGLLISAIRIISREPVEEGQPLRRTRNSPIWPRRRVQDPSNHERHRHAPGAGAAPPSRNSKAADLEATKTKQERESEGRDGVAQGVLLDEVVKDALAGVWDLEKDTPQEGSSWPRNPKNDPTAKGTNDDTSGEGKKGGGRSLQALYADLEGMGLSVDDLTQALDEAYRGGDGGAAASN